MQVISIEGNPISCLPYAAPDGMRRLQRYELPLMRAEVAALPDGVDALICTADLQGREAPGGRLLGELLADHLVLLAKKGILPAPEQMGALLCGDLYARTDLDRRGGNGDVRSVWRTFARHFRWVAGVAGNHDHFGASPKDFERFCGEAGIYYLDGHCVDIEGLRVAGIGGIVGNPRRPFRRAGGEFVRLLHELLARRPDILLLHEGPSGNEAATSKGNAEVRGVLERGMPLACVFGHGHWQAPLDLLANGSCLLNVDARVVILRC